MTLLLAVDHDMVEVESAAGLARGLAGRSLDNTELLASVTEALRTERTTDLTLAPLTELAELSRGRAGWRDGVLIGVGAPGEGVVAVLLNTDLATHDPGTAGVVQQVLRTSDALHQRLVRLRHLEAEATHHRNAVELRAQEDGQLQEFAGHLLDGIGVEHALLALSQRLGHTVYVVRSPDLDPGPAEDPGLYGDPPDAGPNDRLVDVSGTDMARVGAVHPSVPSDELLSRIALVKALRPLVLNGTIQNVPSIFNAAAPLGMAATREQLWPQGGMIPREALEAMALQIAGLMPWNLRLALYGDRQVVERHLELIREAFSGIDGVVIEALILDGEEVNDERDDLDQKGKVQACIPDMYMLDALKWDGGDGGHLCLGKSGQLKGQDARNVVTMIREGMERHGFEYGFMFVINPRSFIHLALQFYDKTRPERGEAAFTLVREMVPEIAKQGYAEYRSHLDQMDLVADQYNWNDQAHLRMVEKIKDALDPDGIFAPGKQGIWPRRMR